MRKILVGVLACLPIAAAAQQPVKLKFATFSPDTERLYNTVKKPWVAAVNKASGGAIEIELYPNGALGRAPQQQAQMVIDGVTDIGFIVPPFTPGRFPDSEVLELPGMFQDLAEGTRVYTRLVQNGTLKDYGDYYPIAMWSTPPFSLHSNFPIASIKDLKGKRVRGSGVIQIESLKGLGAVTVGMPPTEVPEALSPLAVVMNRKVFEGLPKAGQDAIRKYDMDYINKLYIDSMLEYDSSLVKKLESDPKRKVVFPDAADQKAAQAAFEPVIKAWAAKSPRHADVYKALTTELEKERTRK